MPRKDGITATRDLKTLFHTQKGKLVTRDRSIDS